MKLPPLEEGVFVERLNRFACRVERGGKEEIAHLANSGRLREVLHPGRRVLLAPATTPRRTTCDLVLVSLGGGWVSVDARLPPSLVAEAILRGRLAPFRDYRRVRREVPLGDSRIDLLLEDGVPCYVEVKSITLVKGGVGLFPDAPTLRGRRHVEGLAAALGPGVKGAIAFVVQRGDARAFSPNDATDPVFGQALRRAAGQGVGVYAFRCRVTPREIEIDSEIPVLL
ncbi:MAG: DNA/RNA nuclease SfsA [Chloroflexota bacterium]